MSDEVQAEGMSPETPETVAPETASQAATAPEAAAPEGAPAPKKKRGLYFTPKQAFIGLAVVLLLALLALLAYLFFLLQPKGLGERGGSAVEGIQPLFTIEGPGKGTHATFDRPLGVAFGADGRIYVADTGNNRICMFDANGGFIKEWGAFGVGKPAAGGVYSWKPGRLNFPDGLATDSKGRLYVADFRNDCIQVFDKDGKWINRFPDPTKRVGRGSSGQDGTGIAVTAVAVKDDLVYATDTYQVFVFDTSGKLVRQFGKPGNGPGDLDHPNGITVGEDGSIYVADSNHARVTAFTPTGAWKWNAGRIPAGMNDTTTADFQLPRGMAVLSNGDVIVVDVFSFGLVRLSPKGKVVGTYGTRGVKAGEFNFPNAVSVVGSKLAVADKENNRVQVLKLAR